MLEIQGNLFHPPRNVDAICITTNKVVKRNGALVMGRGVALTAAQTWPSLAGIFGVLTIKLNGRVFTAGQKKCPNGKVVHVVNFPTKDHWKNPSTVELIKTSAIQLSTLTDGMGWNSVWLPRPGCANGKLSWENQVKAMLLKMLDDRFTVVRL